MSPVEICILYIFMGYVEDELFPRNEDAYVYIKYACICRVHPTTEYSVLSFLSQQIEKVPSLEILKIILERTQNCGFGLIWTILQDFVKGNLALIEE